MNLLLWMLLFQAIDEVKLGANGPLRADGCIAHRIDNFARRSGDISNIVHLLWAFRMNEDLNAWVVLSKGMDVLRLKHLVNGAMPFPKNDTRVLDGLQSVAPKFWLMGVPNRHGIVSDSHFERSVATQMLVRKKEDSLALSKGPIENCLGIAARANDTAMPTAEGF